MRNKSKKVAFTLVEMLIVVVIIWILAAALIPRLTWAQERSRDAARKAHLNQLIAALTTYNSESGQFPGTWAITKDTNDITWVLIPNFIKTMPSDPQVQRSFKFVWTATDCLASTTQWTYAYTPLSRNGAPYAGMIVAANMETPWKNNTNFVAGDVFDTTNRPAGVNDQWCIIWGWTTTGDAVDLEVMLCKTWVDINKDSSTKNSMIKDGKCVAKSATNIMYVMIQ